jgi:AcrR family transcriptional regulator
MVEKSEYHHGDLRQALIDAALRALETDSVDAVTMRRLAREAGVSHAAPYHHFPDLDALLAAVAARGFGMLQGEIAAQAAATAPDDPFQRLQNAGTAYVAFALSKPELFRLMFSGRWKDVGQYSELERAEGLAFESLQGMMAGATGEPAGREKTLIAARTAWALVHGIAVLLVDGRIETQPGMEPMESAERLTREVMAVLGRGLRSLRE